MHPAWGAYPDTILQFPEVARESDLRCPLPPDLQAQVRSADGRHLERGWALAIPLEEAEMLAARFFQTTLF